MLRTANPIPLAALMLIIAETGLTADTAPRDEAPEPGERTFEALDQNNDGKISSAEARSDESLQKLFSGLDSDKDGTLSRGEFAAYDPAGAAENI